MIQTREFLAAPLVATGAVAARKKEREQWPYTQADLKTVDGLKTS